MQVITQTATCLCIKPSGVITPIRLTYDNNIIEKLINLDNSEFKNICENMKLKNNCNFYRKNIAKAIYPGETYYHMFYEYNAPHMKGTFNKLATHIANSYCDTNDLTRDTMCYGDCYIIHFDSQYQLYDIATTTFVNLYNKIYTTKSQEDRNYIKLIYKQKNSTDTYCLFNDYGVINI